MKTLLIIVAVLMLFGLCGFGLFDLIIGIIGGVFGIVAGIFGLVVGVVGGIIGLVVSGVVVIFLICLPFILIGVFLKVIL